MLSSSGQLPSRWHCSPSRQQMVDEHLAQLLMLLGLPDPDIHLLSSRTALAEGARDGAVAHVCTERVETAGKDMDNAWTEAQLWAVELRSIAGDSVFKF